MHKLAMVHQAKESHTSRVRAKLHLLHSKADTRHCRWAEEPPTVSSPLWELCEITTVETGAMQYQRHALKDQKQVSGVVQKSSKQKLTLRHFSGLKHWASAKVRAWFIRERLDADSES